MQTKLYPRQISSVEKLCCLPKGAKIYKDWNLELYGITYSKIAERVVFDPKKNQVGNLSKSRGMWSRIRGVPVSPFTDKYLASLQCDIFDSPRNFQATDTCPPRPWETRSYRNRFAPKRIAWNGPYPRRKEARVDER